MLPKLEVGFKPGSAGVVILNTKEKLPITDALMMSIFELSYVVLAAYSIAFGYFIHKKHRAVPLTAFMCLSPFLIAFVTYPYLSLQLTPLVFFLLYFVPGSRGKREGG